MNATENIIKFPRRRRASGFTQIPNDLIGACMSPLLRGAKATVLLAVARLTIGWGEDRARLTLTGIAETAQMSKSHVSEVLKALEEMGAIEVIYTRQGRVIGLIEDYEALCSDHPNGDRKGSDHPNPKVRTTRTPSSLDKESIKYIPPVVPQSADAEQRAEPKPKRKGARITFDAFLATCKAKGEKPIPETHPAFAFAERTGLPVEWLRLAWCEFRDRHAGTGKTYIDWRAAFGKAVRDNWYRIWFVKDGAAPQLTSQGLLMLRDLQAKEAQA